MLPIEKIKRALIVIGSVSLATGAFMSYKFGSAMSEVHGVTLALLSCFAAIMFTAIDHLRHTGVLSGWKLRTAFTVALVFLGAELFSHVGYTVGTRVENTEMTGIQNTKYADTREAVTDHKAQIAMWQERLKTLTAQHAWAPTTKADGLRAQLDSAQKAIDLETARGGCKSRCLALMKDKASIEERISIAEEAENLTRQINATQALIDRSREKAAATEFKSSPIVNQTKFVAQLTTLSLEPGAAPLTWVQIAIGMLIAIVTTFLSPFAFYLAFGDSLHKAQPTTGFSRGKEPSAETAASAPPAYYMSRPTTQSVATLTINDLLATR